MSWGRGFFRLWLVISAFWLALWGGIWWATEIPPEFIPEETVANPYFGYFGDRDDPRNRPCLDAEGVTKAADLKTAAAQTRFQRCLVRINMWRSRIEFLTIGLIPPLALLALGLLFAWVIAGFRRRPA